MRSTFYTSDVSTFVELARIAKPGWLIVVPDKIARMQMRTAITMAGGRLLYKEVRANALVNVAEARAHSVEVRTIKEIEQMDANEKMAMEVW